MESVEDLVAYVTDDLTEYFKDLSDKEFLRQAKDYLGMMEDSNAFPNTDEIEAIVEEIKERSHQ